MLCLTHENNCFKCFRHKHACECVTVLRLLAAGLDPKLQASHYQRKHQEKGPTL
jgi:hypothetical protein